MPRIKKPKKPTIFMLYEEMPSYTRLSLTRHNFRMEGYKGFTVGDTVYLKNYKEFGIFIGYIDEVQSKERWVVKTTNIKYGYFGNGYFVVKDSHMELVLGDQICHE